MGSLAGQLAIVIGGSRGIGAAITRRLVAEGASVAIFYLSRTKEAEKLANDHLSSGGNVRLIQCDASVAAALRREIDVVAEEFGRLDILVSVVGLSIVGPLVAYSDDDFDKVFALNVRAPFIAAQRASRHMQEGGRLIMVGSVVADRMPGDGGTLYAASKAALGGMTRGLARDLGQRGITCNLVQPGPVDTERNPADGPNAAANRAPLAILRQGRPEEVAGLVAYLASAEAAFVTGATYNIDGGWSA